MKYTVCVFRELSSDCIDDRYVTCVDADSVEQAGERAIHECAGVDEEFDFDLYRVGPVFEGELDDLN